MEQAAHSRGKIGVVVAVVAIILFLGITIFNYVRFKGQKKEEVGHQDAVPVEAAPVEKRGLNWDLELTGDTRPRDEVNVYSKVPGKIIERLPVEKGDLVTRGDLIASLEDDSIRAQLREARAAVRSAKANLEQIEANLVVIKKDRDRMQSLIQESAVSQQKLDNINARYDACLASKRLALAQIESAEAALNCLEIVCRDHKICAPISGIVSARYVDQGALTDKKEPIVRISNEKTLKILATVAERDYPHIRRGMEADILVDAFPSRAFRGVISVIDPTLDPATRTGGIEIYIRNQDGSLHSGMFAHIRLHMGKREVIGAPRDALNRLPGTGSYYVYIVQHEKAVLKNVKVGVVEGQVAEIVEGLEVGDQVVVKGQNRLKDGMVVRVQGRIGARVKGQEAGGKVDR